MTISMNTLPVFTGTPRLEVVRLTAANTNHDGTGTITTLITGVTAGTQVTKVVATAEVTTTAGMIRLWTTVNGGTNWYLYDEVPVAANTVSASNPGSRTDKSYDDLVLRDSNCRLGVTTHNAEAHVIVAHGGDFTA